MLKINKVEVAEAIHALAIANGVSDSQMANYIFRNFYVAEGHLRLSTRIKRHSVAITNLTSQL